MEKCGKCSYWIPVEAQTGDCHRYPPAIMGLATREMRSGWGWLRMDANETGCGEFRPREEAPADTIVTDQVNTNLTTSDTDLLKEAIMKVPVPGRVGLSLARLKLDWPLWRVGNAMGVSRRTVARVEHDQYTQPSLLAAIKSRLGDEAYNKVFGGGKG